MIRRPPRSTLDRSSAASDVYKRQPHRRCIQVGEVELLTNIVHPQVTLLGVVNWEEVGSGEALENGANGLIRDGRGWLGPISGIDPILGEEIDLRSHRKGEWGREPPTHRSLTPPKGDPLLAKFHSIEVIPAHDEGDAVM